MAKRVKRLRHAIAQALTFVGFEGELTVDTTNKSVRVHDGSTPGGFEQSRADLNNAIAATNANDGKMTAVHVQTQEAVVISAAQNASDIAAEIVDRVADVDVEETRALAAEAALQVDVDAAQATADAILGTIYPVGALYIGTTSTNPSTILGFGNWQAFGQNRVMISAGDLYGDEATGGNKDAVVVSHAHTDTFANVAHGGHSHDLSFNNVVGSSLTNAATATGQTGLTEISNGATSGGAHNHTINGSVDSEGVSGVNANLPPYIGVYMWKRIS